MNNPTQQTRKLDDLADSIARDYRRFAKYQPNLKLAKLSPVCLEAIATAKRGKQSSSRDRFCIARRSTGWKRDRRFCNLASAFAALATIDPQESAYIYFRGWVVCWNFDPQSGEVEAVEAVEAASNPPSFDRSQSTATAPGREVEAASNPPSFDRLQFQRDKFVASIAARSIRQTGGFTIDPTNPQAAQPNRGWVVSTRCPELFVGRDRFEAIRDSHRLERYIRWFVEANRPKPGLLLGGWVDSCGNLILNFSRRFESLPQAILFGIEQQQTAIFDCESGDSVNLADFAQDCEGSTGLQEWSRGDSYPIGVWFEQSGEVAIVGIVKTGRKLARFAYCDLASAEQYATAIAKAARGEVEAASNPPSFDLEQPQPLQVDRFDLATANH